MSGDNPHDAFFRFAFKRPEVAVQHFRTHLPEGIARAVVWETLETRPGTYVEPELRQLHSDVLYRVRLRGGGRLCLYVLFEHQSKPNALMPLRLLRYMLNIWAEWVQQETPPLPLPFIVPMVLYHGDRRWNVPTQFQHLFYKRHRNHLDPFLPDFHHRLQDLSQVSDEALQGEALWRLVMLAFKHANHDDLWERFPAWVEAMAQVLQQPPDGLSAIEALLRYVVKVTPNAPPQDIFRLLREGLNKPTEEILMGWAAQRQLERLTDDN